MKVNMAKNIVSENWVSLYLSGLVIVIGILLAYGLAGCKSIEDKTVTTTIDPATQKVSQTIVVTHKEVTPWFYKAMTSIARVLGVEVTFFDPSGSGSISPSIKFLSGDVEIGSLPVTSGGEATNVTEEFGTYKETFTYDKSFWSGSEIGSMTYHREAGGKGVSTSPAIKITVLKDKDNSTTSAEIKPPVK